jgi:hypothetical protein
LRKSNQKIEKNKKNESSTNLGVTVELLIKKIGTQIQVEENLNLPIRGGGGGYTTTKLGSVPDILQPKSRHFHLLP